MTQRYYSLPDESQSRPTGYDYPQNVPKIIAIQKHLFCSKNWQSFSKICSSLRFHTAKVILQYELGNFLSKWELLKISYYKDDIAVQIGELSLKMEAHQRLVSLTLKRLRGGGIKMRPVQTLAILSRMKVGVSILHVITIFGV